MTGKKIVVLLFLAFSFLKAEGQFLFENADNITVKQDSSVLKYAWAGGLNNPQFSSIDIDLDGVQDLLVFDRNSSKIHVFLRSPLQDTVLFYADFQSSVFPSNLKNWVLARDFNCDMKSDLFVHNELGISIYQNTSAATFQLEKFNKGKPLKSDYGSGEVTLLVSGNDIPAISDIDGDGDLDILTFSFFGGNFIEYHQNQSVELYGHCDSMKFILVDPCWGKVEENASTNILNLFVTCKGSTLTIGDFRHIGSTLTTMDYDNDGDQDLLLGDLTFKKMTFLLNGGDSSSALIVSQDPEFPSEDTTIDISEFPAAFNVDVNLDGRLDLLAAPNAQTTEDQENAWLYLNQSSNDTAEFRFSTNSFLTGDMLDVGTGSHPALMSYNYDAIDDLLIANAYSYDDGDRVSQIDAYVNVGSANQPEFELFRKDVGGVSSFGWSYLKIAFADLDGDNDQDMVIGTEDGEIHYFEHFIGIVPEPVFIHNDSFLGPLIDIGLHAAPHLNDLNNDGLIDLIVGESNGRINYFENTGTVSQPIFTFITDFFGMVDVSGAQSNGFCVPFVFDTDGSKFLAAGSESGEVFLFNNIDNNLAGQFNKVSEHLFNANLGKRTAPVVWDFNLDGEPDFLVGNSAGGIHLMKAVLFNSTQEVAADELLQVFPNPCYDHIRINRSDIFEMVLHDLNGRELMRTDQQHLDVSKLKPAIYILSVILKSGETLTEKIVKI